jgi:uncharacterized protein YndB with AHSA1/START domain
MKWILRILLALAAVVVLCVAALWIAGMRSGAGDLAAEIVIERPAPQVWRWLADDKLVLKWVGGLTEIRWKSGAPGQANARADMVAEMEGKRFEMDWENLAVEPERHIAFRVKSKEGMDVGFVETGDYWLEDSGGRTRLRLATHSNYIGFIPRLFEPIISASARKKLAEDLARLKSLVEAEPAATSTEK